MAMSALADFSTFLVQRLKPFFGHLEVLWALRDGAFRDQERLPSQRLQLPIVHCDGLHAFPECVVGNTSGVDDIHGHKLCRRE